MLHNISNSKINQIVKELDMYGSITDKINYHLLKDEVEKLYSTLPVSYSPTFLLHFSFQHLNQLFQPRLSCKSVIDIVSVKVEQSAIINF